MTFINLLRNLLSPGCSMNDKTMIIKHRLLTTFLERCITTFRPPPITGFIRGLFYFSLEILVSPTTNGSIVFGTLSPRLHTWPLPTMHARIIIFSPLKVGFWWGYILLPDHHDHTSSSVFNHSAFLSHLRYGRVSILSPSC